MYKIIRWGWFTTPAPNVNIECFRGKVVKYRYATKNKINPYLIILFEKNDNNNLLCCSAAFTE